MLRQTAELLFKCALHTDAHTHTHTRREREINTQMPVGKIDSWLPLTPSTCPCPSYDMLSSPATLYRSLSLRPLSLSLTLVSRLRRRHN